MKRTRHEVEDLVRRHAWPAPPAELRGRVLAGPPVPESARLHGDLARPDTAGAPPWQWRPSFGVLLALSIICSFGACVGADVWTGRSLEIEVARLEALYDSLDRTTLLVPAVPAENNRAHVARAAAALVVRPTNAERNALAQLRGLSTASAAVRAFGETNGAAVRAARDIRARGQSNWDIDYTRETQARPWAEIRDLADAIWVSALLDLEAGRADDAAGKLSSGLALAASMRQEPELIAQLTRIAIVDQHVSGIRRLLVEAEPSRPALDEVSRLLAESRAPDPIRSGLLGELKQAHAILMRMADGDVDGNIAVHIYPQTWPALPASWYGPIARMARPMVRLAHARYLRRMGDLLEVQAGPRPRQGSPGAITPRRWELVDRLVEKFASGMESLIETSDDFRRELGTAEAAVALRRYRLSCGSYPDTLSSIVPVYLAALPIDPGTGRPPIYTRQGTGFTLRAQNERRKADPRLVPVWNVPR